MRDRHEVGGEAGGLAGAHDEAVAEGSGPVVVLEVGDADGLAVSQRVVGGKGDHEALAEKIVAFQVRGQLARAGGVIEAEGEV